MPEPRDAYIVGLGHHLPPRVVRNEDLPATLGVEPRSILKRTGIASRHWADTGTYTSDMGAAAARAALADAGCNAQDVDCLILTTQTPDHAIPGTGVRVQAKLGLAGIPCLDLRNQCAGFLYALRLARALVRGGDYRRVLIVSAELQSHALGVSPKHAHMTPLFGDGAGAALVADAPRAQGASLSVPWISLHADGAGFAHLRHRVFDISLPRYHDLELLGEDLDLVMYGEMNGEQVFRSAVRAMADVCRAGLRACGLTVDDLAYFAPHQANASICKTVASVLEVPPEKVLMNIETVGNVSSASIPVLLDQKLPRARLRQGDRVLCAAFGAGFAWAGALLEAHVHA